MVTFAFVANSYEYKCAGARVKQAYSEIYSYLEGGNGAEIREAYTKRYTSKCLGV